MTFTEQQKKGQEVLNTIIRKSWEDETFKQELISNPVAIINNMNLEGLDIPVDKKIVAEDQTDTSKIFLNIPAKPDLDSLELSDEELESISGGTDVIAGIAFVSLAFASYMYFKE